jgi:hypothetical protein
MLDTELVHKNGTTNGHAIIVPTNGVKKSQLEPLTSEQDFEPPDGGTRAWLVMGKIQKIKKIYRIDKKLMVIF